MPSDLSKDRLGRDKMYRSSGHRANNKLSMCLGSPLSSLFSNPLLLWDDSQPFTT